MQNRQIIQLTLLTALAPVFWGTTYIVTTELLPAHRPFIAAVIRVLPAGLMLILLSGQIPKRRDMLKIVILSLLNIGCFQTLLFVAAYLLPGGIAAVVSSLQPLIMMLLIWSLEHVKPHKSTLALALASVAGMVMMLVKPDAQWNTAGLIAALAGAVSMSFGTYLSSRWKLSLSTQAFTGWQLFIGGAVLLPVAFYYESFPADMTLKNYVGYAYLAFFGTLVAYYLWFQGLKRLSPVAVSVLGLLSPVTAVTAGWVFLRQSLNPVQFMGFVSVLVCIALMQWNINRKRLA